jgi:thiol-disulfide isomerase/thioredoxin
MKNLSALLFLFCFNLFAQKQLPAINLSDINGKTTSILNEFSKKDKIYIFSFWATWCTPCIAELEELNEVQSEWKKNIDFDIIAIATDDSRTVKRVKPLVNGKDWDYIVLLDSNQDFKRALNIVNIPYTIVVKNGLIMHIQNGYTPGNENELLAKLKSL